MNKEGRGWSYSIRCGACRGARLRQALLPSYRGQTLWQQPAKMREGRPRPPFTGLLRKLRWYLKTIVIRAKVFVNPLHGQMMPWLKPVDKGEFNRAAKAIATRHKRSRLILLALDEIGTKDVFHRKLHIKDIKGPLSEAEE